MGTFLAILAILAVVGVSILVGMARRAANKALTQKVFNRSGHARGQAVTHEIVEFYAPVPAPAVVDEILRTMALPGVAGGFVAQLYVVGTDDHSIVFGFGNKLVPFSFRSALVLDDRPGGGSHGRYTVLNWVEGDGIVRAIAELELLANSIRACVSRLGASYAEPTAQAYVASGPGIAAAAVPLALVSVAAATCASCGSPELGGRFCTDCGAAVA